jgi:ribosomal protein S18 acetylase RimI-like enzyme
MCYTFWQPYPRKKLLIRPYNPSTDEKTLLKLWSAVFDEQWPLDPALFHREAIDGPTYQPGDHLLAEIDGQVVGFALTQVSSGEPCRGSLLALGIHPGFRRRGIGRALHKAALARLRDRGAVLVQAGAGATGYLWPGVPADLPAAWSFFNALGWPAVERSFDLIRGLDDYQTPAWVWERVRAHGTVIAQAAPGDEPRVVDFVAREMPG